MKIERVRGGVRKEVYQPFSDTTAVISLILSSSIRILKVG